MKQTILFLRNAELYSSKEAALSAINGVAHVAGQPVVALYGTTGEVKLIFAIGTESGKCNILATDADLESLNTLVTGLRTDLGTSSDTAAADGSAFARIAKLSEDVEAITSGDESIDKKIEAAISALKGEGFEAATLAALEDTVGENTAAIAKLNGTAEEEGSVAKAIADSEAATKTAYEAYADQAETDAITAAAADAKAKIEALDVEEISEAGKYISAVSETDGKISATLKQIEAGEVAIADDNDHFTATTVEAALDELYTKAGAGSKVTMTSEAGTGDVATIYTFYQGGEDVDHKIGVINIAKDLVVSKGEVVEADGKPVLQLTLNDVAGSIVSIDLSSVMDVYTSGNGIDVSSTNVVSIKKATDSEEFLVVDENGIAIKGVSTAISTAKGEAIAAAKTETEGQVKAAKDAIDAYTVNGKAISTNPVLGGGDINYAEGTTVNAKIDEVAQAVADEQSRAERVEGELEEAIANAQAAASTVVNTKAEGHVLVSEETAEDGHKIYTVTENDIASAQGLADEINRATQAELALTEIVEDINAELGKVKVSAEGTADYLSNKVVTGTAVEGENVYAVTATAADDKIALTCKIDVIDGGTY